jgi:hypothetical protein
VAVGCRHVMAGTSQDKPGHDGTGGSVPPRHDS